MDNKRKDDIDQERHQKKNHHHNYRLITFLQMMWKILRPQIREEKSRWAPPKKVKDATREPEGQDNYYILVHILNESKNRRKYQAIA